MLKYGFLLLWQNFHFHYSEMLAWQQHSRLLLLMFWPLLFISISSCSYLGSQSGQQYLLYYLLICPTHTNFFITLYMENTNTLLLDIWDTSTKIEDKKWLLACFWCCFCCLFIWWFSWQTLQQICREFFQVDGQVSLNTRVHANFTYNQRLLGIFLYSTGLSFLT